MSSCRALRLSALIALGLFSTQASAEAKTHRFEPSPQVAVSLKLGKAQASGTLLRFVRSRVSLSRARSGALVLRRAGTAARRLATPRHCALRVRVTVSANTGTAKLSFGGRSVSVASRFVAENALQVRSGNVISSLRIVPSGAARAKPGSPINSPPTASPTTTLSPSATPTPTPIPTPSPPAPGRLFAPDSVWNAPLRPDAPLDPASPELVQKLRDQAALEIAALTGPWIATDKSSTPLYVAPPGQPTVRVKLGTGAWATSLQTALDAVPIPADAQPALGSDGHITIWQPSTDKLWELWRARKLPDGWHAEFGGAMNCVSTSAGYYSTDSWPSLSNSAWGATATSLPVIGGTMRIDELRAGVIPHALALNIPLARKKYFSWPAQRTDGASPDPQAIPEGARFRIDPNLDLSKISMPSMTRMMAVAAQRYGLIVRDQTGNGLSFFGEDWRQSGSSPYYGADGFFGGNYATVLMRTFPWQHLQLVKMDLRSR